MVVEAAQNGPLLAGPGAKRDYKPTPLGKLTRSQQESIHRAKKYAVEQGIKRALFKQTIAHQQQQMVNTFQQVQRQQALALMCRIYVGSINFEIKEDTIKMAFLPFGPIVSISLPYDNVSKKHKGFAFIEYEVPEAATLALEQMNGVMISGYSIKVGRPSNMPQAQPIIEQVIAEARVYNRIYISSVHEDLAEADLKSVFEAFGRILSCQLGRDPSKPLKHKGYAYIEYDNAQSCIDAVSAMNLFDIGGQYLRVGKCVTPPNTVQCPVVHSSLPTASAIAAAAITAKITAQEAVNQPLIPPPTIAVPVAVTVGVIQPAFLPVLPSVASMTSPMTSLGLNNMLAPQLNASLLSLQSPPLLTPQLTHQTMGSVHTTPAGFGQVVAPTPQMSFQSLSGVPGVSQQTTTSLQPCPPPPLPPGFDSSQNTFNCSNGRPSLSGQASQSFSPASTDPTQLQSRVLLLRNMVDVDEVDEDLEGEVAEECRKYGEVRRVVVHVLKSQDQEMDVRIFVEFSDLSETETARTGLNGRLFAGRSINATIYSQELFDCNNLS